MLKKNRGTKSRVSHIPLFLSSSRSPIPPECLPVYHSTPPGISRFCSMAASIRIMLLLVIPGSSSLKRSCVPKGPRWQSKFAVALARGTNKPTRYEFTRVSCLPVFREKTIQLVLREVQILALLQHKNVLPILGIVTEFSGISGISIVTPWKKKGNAHDYVQNETIDPRSLVSLRRSIRLNLTCNYVIFVSASGDCEWTVLPASP